MRRGVAITGIGPVCSIGNNAQEFWDAIVRGDSALAPISGLDASGFRSKLAGEVSGVSIRDCVPKSYRKATKVMARDTELAVISAKIAAEDAKLVTRGSDDGAEGFTIDPARTGCQIGAGLIAADTEELARAAVSAESDNGEFDMKAWGSGEGGGGGMNNLPPLWLLKYLPNMLACHVTIVHGCEGPSNTIMGAEAAAILSIGESSRVIERGSAEICFSGGAESRINPLGMLRWDYTGRLAPTNDEQDGSSIVLPFDPDATGSLMGESGGMVILEEQSHADARGADSYATVAGFGAAQAGPPVFPGVFEDASSDPVDGGLVRAISWALKDAGISAEQIDAIVPLGLGVKQFDDQEAGALRAVFGDRLGAVPMVTLCPNVGNTMAGHGGLMVAAGALCLHHQKLPARVHKGSPMNGIDAGASDERDASLDYVLVCSGSLGGQAAALVLRRADSSV
jgi:3-oxoacyl-[acyl-carrier-protein] synthase II